MSKKILGDDYRVWLQSAVVDTFNQILGQGNCTINRSEGTVDTSSKDDGRYGSQAPGTRTVSVSLDVMPKLPDANGYTRAETLANADPAVTEIIQIRKNGDDGVAPDDVVFECVVYPTLGNTSLGKGAPGSVTFNFLPAAKPTVDALA